MVFLMLILDIKCALLGVSSIQKNDPVLRQVINKDVFMKKAVLFVMMALILASSLALVSCDSGGYGGSNRAFVGTWVTSQFRVGIGGSYVPATVVFTSSSWTLSVPSAGINQSGKYAPITDSVAKLTQDGLDFGSAQVSSTAMQFTCTSPGTLYGASGQFTKQQQ